MESRTYTVDVDGVGAFECRRRNMRLLAAINAEYNRLTEGADSVSDEFSSLAEFLAYLRVTIVSGPEGWDVYEADPDDPEETQRLQKVYEEVRKAEARFRARPGTESQESSTPA